MKQRHAPMLCKWEATTSRRRCFVNVPKGERVARIMRLWAIWLRYAVLIVRTREHARMLAIVTAKSMKVTVVWLLLPAHAKNVELEVWGEVLVV